jgi:hypothetical protein
VGHYFLGKLLKRIGRIREVVKADWPHNGKVVKADWPHKGKVVKADWPHKGKVVKADWPHKGKVVKADWPHKIENKMIADKRSRSAIG